MTNYYKEYFFEHFLRILIAYFETAQHSSQILEEGEKCIDPNSSISEVCLKLAKYLELNKENFVLNVNQFHY